MKIESTRGNHKLVVARLVFWYCQILKTTQKKLFLLEENKKIFNYKEISESNMSLTRKHTSKQHVVLSTLIYFSYLLQCSKYKSSFFKNRFEE